VDYAQEQIDAFYKELFEDPEFLAELQAITDRLVHKHLVLGEPFDPVVFDATWDDNE
jgi:UDP-glucose 6-dehydrogenase